MFNIMYIFVIYKAIRLNNNNYSCCKLPNITKTNLYNNI